MENSTWGWFALLAAIVGEITVPLLLKPFHPGYRHHKMALSILGSVESPVRWLYNTWMLLAGILFLASLPALYKAYASVSRLPAMLCCLCIGVFAIGACLFTCFFSANETKGEMTTAAKIHGGGSAIGFLLLLFVPLLLAVLFFRTGSKAAGIICTASFVLAVASFVLFIMSDKAAVKGTWMDAEGLWQRLSLLFMYLPLALASIIQILI